MKAYQKPTMLVLSISANDMLCGNCTLPTRNNMDWLLVLDGIQNIRVKDTNNDGAISEDETNLFASGEKGCEYEYEGYCKFTSADNLRVFTS